MNAYIGTDNRCRSNSFINSIRVLFLIGIFAVTASMANSPLHIAANGGDVDKVKALLRQGADTCEQDDRGYTPLHAAIFRGHSEVALILLEADTRPLTMQNCLNSTPLHVAIINGHLAFALTLFRADTRPLTMQDYCGYTPLDRTIVENSRAIDGNFLELAKILLETDTSPLAVLNGRKLTPLEVAKDKEDTKAIKLLLQYNSPQELW